MAEPLEFDFGGKFDRFNQYPDVEALQSRFSRSSSVPNILTDANKNNICSASQNVRILTDLLENNLKKVTSTDSPTSTFSAYTLRGSEIYFGFVELSMKELATLRLGLHFTNKSRSNKDKDNLLSWDKFAFSSIDSKLAGFMKKSRPESGFYLGSLNPDTKPTEFDKELNYNHLEDEFLELTLDRDSDDLDELSYQKVVPHIVPKDVDEKYRFALETQGFLSEPQGIIRLLSPDNYRFHLLKNNMDTLIRRVELPKIKGVKKAHLLYDATASVDCPGHPWVTNNTDVY